MARGRGKSAEQILAGVHKTKSVSKNEIEERRSKVTRMTEEEYGFRWEQNSQYINSHKENLDILAEVGMGAIDDEDNDDSNNQENLKRIKRSGVSIDTHMVYWLGGVSYSVAKTKKTCIVHIRNAKDWETLTDYKKKPKVLEYKKNEIVVELRHEQEEEVEEINKKWIQNLFKAKEN